MRIRRLIAVLVLALGLLGALGAGADPVVQSNHSEIPIIPPIGGDRICVEAGYEEISVPTTCVPLP